MSVPSLESALRSVPFLATAGVRVEDARTGRVVLRLPFAEGMLAHGGTLHVGALFGLAETAAAVAIATHPSLTGHRVRQKSAKVKYYALAERDVTAHAEIHAEELATAMDDLGDGVETTIEIVTRVFDSHGTDIAEVSSRFVLQP
ncbi:MAG: acyl-coenzyme A thioesterase PaaI-like protein [Myxococcota bacterium]|jgi:acyl-coenzyme A thioesterase PaaI-like protein